MRERRRLSRQISMGPPTARGAVRHSIPVQPDTFRGSRVYQPVEIIERVNETASPERRQKPR